MLLLPNKNRPFAAITMAGLILLALFLLPSPVRAQTDTPDKVHYTAIVPRYLPPTYFLDKQTGKADGFAVEVMNRVAEKAGIRIDYIFADNWTEIINAVRSGKADIIPDLGITPERRQYFLFTSPLEVFTVSLYVRSHSPIRALTRETEVGTIKGSVGDEYLKKSSPHVRLVLYDDYSKLLIDLFAGRIDVLAGPDPTIIKSAQELEAEDKIRVIGEPIGEIKRGIAVRADEPLLREKLDNVVREFVDQPEYLQIYQKWYGKPRPFWEPANIAAAASAFVIAVIVLMSVWRYRTALHLNRELRTALETIRTLHGILPICSSCKKIRDDKGAWQNLEAYISLHTDAEFSHGLCTECAQRMYPEVFKKKQDP